MHIENIKDTQILVTERIEMLKIALNLVMRKDMMIASLLSCRKLILKL